MGNIKFLIILMNLLLSYSCLDSGNVRSKKVKSTAVQDGSVVENPINLPPSDTSKLQTIIRSELRHIVDPEDGDFRTKVTIPKNFNGTLYLSGINISALKGKFVFVRFKFGKDLYVIELPATISYAEGITPQADIEVLAIDFKDRPFESNGLRLPYDLYDYNDYRDTSGNETKTPVTDNLDSGLYCRGLDLQYDPTFEGTATDVTCDGNRTDEKCLYAYAKIVDSGLYNSSGIAINPTQMQVAQNTTGYASESVTDLLKKCLPDNSDTTNFGAVLNTVLGSTLAYGSTLSLGGATYTYNGPFRVIGETAWQLSSSAVFSKVSATIAPSGLFQEFYTVGADTDAARGFGSFLFPRAGKIPLRNSIDYFGSTNPFGTTRTLQKMSSSTDSDFVDGCNIRAINNNNGEGIGSCTVSGAIELFTKAVDGTEEIIDSNINLKIQVVRASSKDYQGHEVLYSALKQCNGNSSNCSADECCFNDRCWSDELVSQCQEDSSIADHLGTGQGCQSDYQCSSLCCNPSTNTCGIHIVNEAGVTSCEKPIGTSCVSKEFCQQQSIRECFVVKTGKDPAGQQLCERRCYNVLKHGDCINGTCQAPVEPDVPDFDTSNPDCSSAINPPLNLVDSI